MLANERSNPFGAAQPPWTLGKLAEVARSGIQVRCLHPLHPSIYATRLQWTMVSGMMRSDWDTTILVCRDCCCGNARKHPEVDHDDHLERLEQVAREIGSARLLVTRCLDVCSHSNVVVVRTRAGEKQQSLWFGEILSRRRIEALCAWLRAGGLRTGTPLPATLAFAAFPPSEESSHCAAEEERSA